MHLLEREFDEKIKDMKIFFEQVILTHDKVLHSTILKSSMILMLYNISESSIRKIIEYIHDELSGFDFCVLSDSINCNFLKYNNFNKFPDFKYYLRNKKGALFSGNVDSRKVLKELKKYGISVKLPEEKKYLLNIKSKRNMLAHGNETFKESSRNITNNELEKWIKALEMVFSVVIREVKVFIDNKLYLKPLR